MEWLIPTTIIPGVGLIILSTSNIMLSLNEEISILVCENEKNTEIIRDKLLQLKRLSISIVFQYIGVFLFLVSSILASLLSNYEMFSRWFLFIGVVTMSVSILYLIIYSIKAVSIRQKHLGQ